LADGFERDVYCVLGLPIDAVDLKTAVKMVREAALRRERCFFSTPNLNILLACLEDENFRDSVIASDLVIADGMPLVWISKLLGIPIRERVAGSGMFERLRDEAAANIKVFFFGGKEGMAEIACRRLNADSFGLTGVGFETPGFGSIEDMSSESTIAKINSSSADFLLVSLAARKAQAWLERNRGRITVPVIGNLGATLNFAAGTVNRAPEWMQNYGLEWVWRIKEEPALWRRYASDGLSLIALFVFKVAPYAWFLYLNRAAKKGAIEASFEISEVGNELAVRLHGTLGKGTISPLRDCFSAIAGAKKGCSIDFSEVSYVDSAFIGILQLLHNHQKKLGKPMRSMGLTPRVRRIFRYSCAEYLLQAQE